jgi:hypothetical protein
MEAFWKIIYTILYIISTLFVTFTDSIKYGLTPYDNELLQSSKCKPPCWNGIIPGLTSAEEATSILMEVPAVITSTVRRYSPYYGPYPNGIGWSMKNAKGGAVELSNDISRIIELNGKFTLRGIIDLYGEPDQVVLAPHYYPYLINWYTLIIYQQKGIIAISILEDNNHNEVYIKQSTDVETIVFLDPTDIVRYIGRYVDSYLSGKYISIEQIMQPWNGYGKVLILGKEPAKL